MLRIATFQSCFFNVHGTFQRSLVEHLSIVLGGIRGTRVSVICPTSEKRCLADVVAVVPMGPHDGLMASICTTSQHVPT